MTDKKPGFQPGQSGNPAGRPKGARSKAMQALDAILDGEAEAITRKVIELAKEGDTQALRMCLDRLVPPLKDRPVTFELPPIETTADLTRETNAMLQAVAAGELTPSEAADIGKTVDAHVRAIEAVDLHQRLLRIEEQTAR
ncbi:hypothetical protein ASF58_20825 [Methylobacterium sp. Leaf125]|uniref:DUF5681 domain-containing protein n=1 Tax=Methylobacterium sp. Leaf125 TaxID=1736265 RepID=UPI0006FE6059|nr:DUF5681 domain-containing protein [Methylobacterium sp. Leaf125]KQQ44618.1 hypothetical protein ASF58_20825 [Methylobacterium sp. Leaf125]